MSEKIFMIIFTIVLFIIDVFNLIHIRKTTDKKISIVCGIYLLIIFTLWILYCFYRLNTL